MSPAAPMLSDVRDAPIARTATRATRLDTIVAYGWGEVEELRAWLGPHGPRVEFVAFGVDTESFRPDADAVVGDDVVSIGADPRRDFGLLLDLARRLPLRPSGAT